MTAKVHIVGAGLAGLAAAVRLAQAGRRVVLYEAAPQAGGRCRSYEDRQLGVTLDNGNHLLLSGNAAALRYLETIGAGDSLIGPATARIPFLDLATGQRWELRPRGRLPLWLKRDIPGLRLAEFADLLRLRCAGPKATVAATMKHRGGLWHRLLAPFTISALNTQPSEASVELLWAVLRESVLQGARACRPLIARRSLAESFVDPALAFIRQAGGEVQLGRRLRAIGREGDQATALDFAEGSVALSKQEPAILAVSPWVAAELLPELGLAFEPRPIVNAHLLLPQPAPLPENLPLLGLLGGTAEWLFARGRVVSLTVSAAEAIAGLPQEALAARLWADTAKALALPPEPRPPLRVIVERRATFASTPQAAANRPPTATRWRHLWLAGDYTATGLPSTIEGAIRSGDAAAGALGA
jgi:squalene-associated FAD-dependent desaturase